ncbi:MAG: gliding motility-associated C-terminal domain-containing protein [Saprospiraceae bacterium]|nr:gliding motility-associated C-terminal domain-containing protein [Candidatus Vicinibacter affinis]
MFQNAFSPNGDGVNDYWIPIGSHSSVQFHNIEVYDRWGGQIFNWSPNIKDELPIGWDGKFKDHPMTPEFMYIALATLHSQIQL